MSLDFSSSELDAALHQVSELLTAVYAEAEHRPVFPGVSPGDVRSRFDETLPEEGMNLNSLLEKVESDVLPLTTCNIGPHFYGYITGGGNQVAVLAEMIRTAINQNNLKWHSSPISSEMEQLVIRWLAQFMGYPSDCVGALLSGGSVANFEALAVARHAKAPVDLSEKGLYDCPPLTVYVSEEGHSSFDKAVDMLGMGRKYLRTIPTDEAFQMDTNALEQRIRRDRQRGLHPVCAIGVAGTTNTGAVDDLQSIAAICQRHDLWFHVDAAYGGPAAALPSASPLFAGLDRADSVVVNPHKWLYVPFEAGATLYRDREMVRNTFSFVADYLRSEGAGRLDQMELNLPLTKGFKAFKVWMTIKAYGAKRLREAIQCDIDKAQYLCAQIEEASDLELLAPSPLSIVCFRVLRDGMDDSALNRFNQKIIDELEGDGRVFLTGTSLRGQTALRVCFINHRSTTGHVDRLLRVVRDVATSVSV